MANSKTLCELDSGARIFVPQQDGQTLAGAVQRLTNGPKTWYKIGAEGEAKVKKEFVMSHVVENSVELFAQKSREGP